jgi:hypothetical protein
MLEKKLIAWREKYIPKILNSKGMLDGMVGSLSFIKGFDQYNNLLKLNSVFSSSPRFMVVDRTLSTKLPFNYYVTRVWSPPVQKWSLDQAMEQRVYKLLEKGQTVNLLWSGGIDSTALVTAFIKHTPNLGQLRILYSPWSTYEHPEYISFLKNFKAIDLVDISGDRYMNWDFDGIFVTGDSGDESLASIDESFINTHGIEKLHSSWVDLVYAQTNDAALVDFCQQHFKLANRPIETVLHARWWFYTICKSRSVLSIKSTMLFDREKFNIDDLQGFYDCNEFENYTYWDLETAIIGSTYLSWKQKLKEYAYKFDNLESWYNTKTKHHSAQPNRYWDKKIALSNSGWIAIDTDGIKHSTPSLPVLTIKEFDKHTDLDWAFNQW